MTALPTSASARPASGAPAGSWRRTIRRGAAVLDPPDGRERAEAGVDRIEHLHAQSGQRGGALGEARRADHVRRRVDELARDVRPARDHLGARGDRRGAPPPPRRRRSGRRRGAPPRSASGPRRSRRGPRPRRARAPGGRLERQRPSSAHATVPPPRAHGPRAPLPSAAPRRRRLAHGDEGDAPRAQLAPRRARPPRDPPPPQRAPAARRTARRARRRARRRRRRRADPPPPPRPRRPSPRPPSFSAGLRSPAPLSGHRPPVPSPVVHARILGSAAGGGFPQWNCRCPTCEAARTGTTALPRTQSSLAIRGASGPWFLVNASPDLRQQLEALPAERGTASAPPRGRGPADGRGDRPHGRPAAAARVRDADPRVRERGGPPRPDRRLSRAADPRPLLRRRVADAGARRRRRPRGSSLEVEAFAAGGDAPRYLAGSGADVEASGLVFRDRGPAAC